MAKLQTIDLSQPRRIHILGIGGTGMSSIARVLHAMGHQVSGTDAAESPTLDSLRELGIDASGGHDASNIVSEIDVVAISTAIAATNVEVVAANAAGIPVVSRAEILGAIARVRDVVAVAGTHGKTTTSSLVAAALVGAGLDPSWIVGGNIGGRGGAHWGSGNWLVLEADESDGTFLTLGSRAAIVTNVEPDHLEHYGGWPQLQAAFGEFVSSIDGPVVVCLDDDGVRDVLGNLDPVTRSGRNIVSYGCCDDATWQIQNVRHTSFGVSFEVCNSELSQEIQLPLPGIHNARNAAAAFCLGMSLGGDPRALAKGIESFSGVARRFEQRGTKSNIDFVDDYAHLPTEVAAAIRAAKDGDWKRVVAVFQPHRYSRTEQVGKDFAHSFDDADVVVLADVYAAGEAPRAGIDGMLVANAVAATGKEVVYEANRANLATKVASVLQPGDICLSLGAGDITKLADEVQEKLR